MKNLNFNQTSHKLKNTKQNLEEIENYKTQGTIIRPKKKITLNQEKTTKHFFIQEKQKECNNYFQKIYTKQNTCKTTQNVLLKDTLDKATDIQNH